MGINRSNRGGERAHSGCGQPAGTVLRVQQCDDCPSTDVSSVFPGFGKFCADCAATRALRPGGLPDPPSPPGPVTITGPDGQVHHFVFVVQRYASGTGVELVECGGGYRFSTISALGRHDLPIDAQVRHLLQVAKESIAQVQVASYPPDGCVLLTGQQVVGRLVWPAGADIYDRPPYNVVVDGREMTWEEFGRALEPFEGMRLRLVVQDSVDEVHDSDAEAPGRSPST